MNTSSEAIEKVATALAQRAFVVRNSPKSSVFADSLRESDVITKAASDILDRRVMEKQANPYQQATNWFKGLQPGTQQSMRNAAIGLGAGALGGAALNMMNTDKDDEDRHPFSSAVTGALGGAALGGLGTLGLNQLNKNVLSDPDAGDTAVAAALEAAENPGTQGMKGWLGRLFGTSEDPPRSPDKVGVPSVTQRVLGAPFAAFSREYDALPLASGPGIEGSGVSIYDDVRDIMSQYTGGLGEPALRAGGAAGLIHNLRGIRGDFAIDRLSRGVEHLAKQKGSQIGQLFPQQGGRNNLLRQLVDRSRQESLSRRGAARLGAILDRVPIYGTGGNLGSTRLGGAITSRLGAGGAVPVMADGSIPSPARATELLDDIRTGSQSAQGGPLRRLLGGLRGRRVGGGAASAATLAAPELSALLAGFLTGDDRARAIRDDAALYQRLQQMQAQQNQR